MKNKLQINTGERQMADEYMRQPQPQAENWSIADVRLSCFQEVWQKWCESKSTQEFDEWLHAQMHEA